MRLIDADRLISEAYSAMGKVSDDCAWMIHASDGDVLRAWYNEALQDMWKLFNAVNSRLLDEGKG